MTRVVYYETDGRKVPWSFFLENQMSYVFYSSRTSCFALFSAKYATSPCALLLPSTFHEIAWGFEKAGYGIMLAYGEKCENGRGMRLA